MHKLGIALAATLMGGAAITGFSHFTHAQTPSIQDIARMPGHVITITPDGGRVEVKMAGADADDMNAMREHIKFVTTSLAAGDLGDSPLAAALLCHPGVKTMVAKHSALTYAYSAQPNGADVRISSKDAEAVDAIHAFLKFLSEHTAEAESHTTTHSVKMTHAQQLHQMLGMHKESTHVCAE